MRIGTIFPTVLITAMAVGCVCPRENEVSDRHVMVVFNGVKIIDNAPIRGVTGGAMTSDESNPGPIYLQGDHSSAEYRNMVLTPVLGR